MDLSIIIPTYKTGNYIIEALQSIEQQGGINFKIEIIIVLNGERDPYFDLLKSIDISVPYKIIYTDIKGVSNARNIGIKEAKGKYLLFLDDDDMLSDNYINTLLSNAKNDDTLYISNLLCFKDGEKEYYKDYIGKFIGNGVSRNKFSILEYTKLMSSSCFKLIPKKIIGNTIFNTNLSISEDALFMFAISKNINNIEVFDEVFYYRRVRKNSAMKVKKDKSVHVKNYLKFTKSLTVVYVKNIYRLNFYFYLNRIMASTKFMINNMRK